MIIITNSDPVLPASGRCALAMIRPVQPAEMIFAVFEKCSVSGWQWLSAVGTAWHWLAPPPSARSRVLHVCSTGRRVGLLAPVGTPWQGMGLVGIHWLAGCAFRCPWHST